MAFCGWALTDEEKDGENGDIHSLDNIVALSTKMQQMCAPSNEQLLIKDENGNPIDRRVKICYDGDEKFFSNSYAQITQITAKVPQGKGIGSASYVPFGKGGILFITCAHNLVTWSSLRGGIPHTNVRVYGRRDGVEKWNFWSESLEKKIVHPRYNGNSYCGYDLGIIIPSKLPGFHSWAKFSTKSSSPKYRTIMDSYLTNPGIDPKHIIKGMTIELMGYPGEKEGFPYTHTGEILNVVEKEAGGWVIYYNSDATVGNSGSPIYLTDEKYMKTLSNPTISKLMIGVHTGNDAAEQCNFGTLLTKSLISWINKEVERFLPEWGEEKSEHLVAEKPSGEDAKGKPDIQVKPMKTPPTPETPVDRVLRPSQPVVTHLPPPEPFGPQPGANMTGPPALLTLNSIKNSSGSRGRKATANKNSSIRDELASSECKSPRIPEAEWRLRTELPNLSGTIIFLRWEPTESGEEFLG